MAKRYQSVARISRGSMASQPDLFYDAFSTPYCVRSLFGLTGVALLVAGRAIKAPGIGSRKWNSLLVHVHPPTALRAPLTAGEKHCMRHARSHNARPRNSWNPLTGVGRILAKRRWRVA